MTGNRQKKGKKIRIAITGATGLLGRNLLFEIIKNNINNLGNLEIFLLGREKNNINFQRRINSIIASDGAFYCSLKKDQVKEVKNFSRTGIKCVEIDLDVRGLGIKMDDLQQLKSQPLNFFFHIAALTDFRNTPGVVATLKKTNIYGTRQVLQLVSSLEVDEFDFTGSAYSCGNTSGNVKANYINLKQQFRNYYEISKLLAEMLVRNYAKKTGLRCRYFRPSTICGRLLEQPLGTINKFDVFYSWAAFFLRTKLKNISDWEMRYTKPQNIDMRICYNLESGLNIVPADYAAKAMYHICFHEDKGESYHLVNCNEALHSLYIPLMLNTLNITGVKHANCIPPQLNKLEDLYYKTVGKVFTPYITSEPILFDIENLKNVSNMTKLSCPSMNETNFLILMDYAKTQNFGLHAKNENRN